MSQEEKLFSQEPVEQNIETIHPFSKIKVIIASVLCLIVVIATTVIIFGSGIFDSSTPSDNNKNEKQKEEDTPSPEVPSYAQTKFNKNYKIIGYYPNWYGDYTSKIQWDKLTHIYYAFGFPSEEGEGKMIPLSDFSEVITPLIKEANAHNVLPVLSMGGWAYYGRKCDEMFDENTNTSMKINSFAKSIVEEAIKYGFKGIDIDWEYPNKETKDAFVEFMLKLKELCTEKNLLLTAAVNPLNGLGFNKEVLDALDFVMLMVYDLGDGPDHSPFSMVSKSFTYWNETIGLKAEKILIGVPFYSRPGSISFDKIISASEENAYKDECVYDGNRVYYNGIPTMKQKAEFAANNGAGGMMFWELSYDTNRKEYSLLNTIYDTTVKIVGLKNKK